MKSAGAEEHLMMCSNQTPFLLIFLLMLHRLLFYQRFCGQTMTALHWHHNKIGTAYICCFLVWTKHLIQQSESLCFIHCCSLWEAKQSHHFPGPPDPPDMLPVHGATVGSQTLHAVPPSRWDSKLLSHFGTGHWNKRGKSSRSSGAQAGAESAPEAGRGCSWLAPLWSSGRTMGELLKMPVRESSSASERQRLAWTSFGARRRQWMKND